MKSQSIYKIKQIKIFILRKNCEKFADSYTIYRELIIAIWCWFGYCPEYLLKSHIVRSQPLHRFFNVKFAILIFEHFQIFWNSSQFVKLNKFDKPKQIKIFILRKNLLIHLRFIVNLSSQSFDLVLRIFTKIASR